MERQLHICFLHSMKPGAGWRRTVAESDRGRTLARRALESAPDDPTAVSWFAAALVNLANDFNVLKGLVDNAVRVSELRVRLALARPGYEPLW